MLFSSPHFVRTPVRVLCATIVAVGIAAVTLFGTFDPAFEGQLWGVRHELALPDAGMPNGVVFINGLLFVADSANQTIVAFNSDGDEVDIAGAQWDSSALGGSPVLGLVPHQLASVVVNKNGTDLTAILVSDMASNRVAAFETTGAHLFTLRLTRPPLSPPSPLESTAQLRINEMAMAPGATFVLDTTGLLPTVSLSGTFVAGWFEQLSSGPTRSGALVYPASSSFVQNGTEFEVSAADVLTGTETDPVAPEPIEIFGVAFDRIGNLYILDAFTERLNVYDPSLAHLFTFGTPVADLTVAEFHEPRGFAFWPDATGTGGRLFVADTYKNRIMVYRPVDGLDADSVVDSLQLETEISNFTLDLDNLQNFSLALDPALNRIALTDGTSSVLVLSTFHLAPFNLQVLDQDDNPLDSVCTGADYRVRFSLTVPAGFAQVTGVLPTLSVNGSPDGTSFPSTTLSAGDVATYTYSLTSPGTAGADIELVASATADNTADIASLARTLSLSDCEGDTGPSTITAEPMRAPQVSGWTPVFEGETFVVTLHAGDPDGIQTIEYQLEGVNESGQGPIAIDYTDGPLTADPVIDIPEPGRTTLRYRMRDGKGIWSSWRSLDLRTKLVVDRTTNENSSTEFRVGDPEGTGFVFSVNRVPDGVTFSTTTGQFAGIPSFEAHQPYSSDPVVASGVYHVVVTETAPGPGGATSDVSFTWTINHINRPPIIKPVAGFTVNAGEPFEPFLVEGSDPDADPSFWTINGVGVNTEQVLPPSVTIDPATGVIHGTFPEGSDTEYSISVGLSECASPESSPACENQMILPGEHLATLSGFEVGVLDVNDPADVTNPGDQFDAENDSVSLQIAASDPDGDPLTYAAGGLPPGLTIDSSSGLISGTVSYTAAGDHSVTVEVDDEANDPRAVTFIWHISNTNRPPTLAIPDRESNEDDTITGTLAGFASDPDGDALTFTSVTNLPEHVTASSSGELSGVISSTAGGTSYSVTAVVSDGSASTTDTFTWTVHNVNHQPVLNVENQLSAEGDVITLQIDGTDPDGDPMIFSMNSDLPAGFSINPLTGVITGVFDFTSAGVYTVNVGVVDPVLGDTKRFTWTVSDTNRKPAITPIADQVNNENDAVILQVIAVDPDGDLPLSYSAANLPPGLSIHPVTGTITGTISYDAAGSYTVTITVSDGHGPSGVATDDFTWAVNNVNRPPTVSAPPRFNAENAAVSYATAASDPDGDTLTYSATGLPNGTSINTSTGEISGTLAYDTAGVHSVTITVSDGSLEASATFLWTITNTNAPPVITNPGPQTNDEGQTISLQITATDPDPDALTFSATGLPPGLSISPSGLISGTLPYTAAGTYTVVVTVTDGSAQSSMSFTWTVNNVNQPPVVINPGTQNSAEGDVIVLPISASDPDGQPLTYSATGLPQNLSINPATGVISGTLSFTSAGTYSLTVTATDGLLSDAETFTWNVANTNRPPTAVADVATVIQGQSVIIHVLANDSDPDGDTLTVTTVTPPSNGSAVISGGGTTVTYTATASFLGPATFSYTIGDGHGGTATAQVTVTVLPSNVPPVCTAAAASPGLLWPPNHKPVYLTLGGVVDPDGGTPTITFTSVLQDEPTNTQGDGNTTQDAGIENNGAKVWVRAERMGGGDGRVYIIGFTATDAQDASCTGTVMVGVPHDQGNKSTPVLSPGRWNSITGALLLAPPPVANDDAISLKKGTAQTVSIQSNDVAYGAVTVSIVSAPSQGAVVVNANGTVTYTAPANWTGSTSFTYRLANGTGSDTAVVSITVKK